MGNIMRGLDPKMMSTMRSIITNYYPDPVSIYSIMTSGYTNDGRVVTTRSLVITVSGQITDTTGNERALIESLINAGNEKIETTKLYLPYSVTISADNEVDTIDGKRWEIVNVDSTKTFTAAHTVLLARKLVDNTGVPV